MTGLQESSSTTAAADMTAAPSGDADYLAESIVAYNKAQAEIEDTYSDKNISARASAEDVDDIPTYTQEQKNNEAAELQKLNQYFSNDTAKNIENQAVNLENFFDGYDNSLDSSDSSQQDLTSSMVNMGNELFSLYGDFSSQNNIDYSSQSVQNIAKQFEDYSNDKVQSTVNLGGVDFSYNDLLSATKVLNIISNGNDNGTSYNSLLGSLGASEVAYVAKNNMSSAASSVLTEAYDSHLQTDNIRTTLLISQLSKGFPTTTSSPGSDPFQNLDTSSADNFKSSFQDAINSLPYGSSYNLLQNNFKAFESEFLD